jgi:glycosyltransferase involved in cell wall biosynthesis
MSEGMVEYYRQAYPGLSVSALLHTFTEPLPAFVPPPEPAPRLRLAFSGCITDSCLDALSRIIMAVRDLEWVDFTFHTPTSPSVFRGLSPLPRHWQFTPLSRERLLAALRQADVLILPHGFEGSFAPIEYETIFPTKTIEYLISGRPILAHSPPNCFLTRFLKEHACALLVEEKSVPALKEALLRLRGDGQLRSQLVRAGLKTAEMFQAGRVADRLRHTIADTISNGRGQ